MCTVSYNSIHTPYQSPPTSLYPPGFTWPPDVPEGCTTAEQVKVISDLMLYALDQEIGRLLVAPALLAAYPPGGSNIIPRPRTQ